MGGCCLVHDAVSVGFVGGIVAGKRCICGRSSRLPLCDGAHASLSWTCAADTPAHHARLFVAAPQNHNIARRLAHAWQGAALHQVNGDVLAEQVTVISDGADVDFLSTALQRVVAPQRQVLLLGGDPILMQAIFPDAHIRPVDMAEHPSLLWRNIQAAMQQSAEHTPLTAADKPLLFVSHATADEPMLEEPIAILRRLGIDFFVCGDSIAGGERWWDAILDALRRCDRFVVVLSEASRQSGWCSFEIGAAVALNKPIQLISLDGLPPPSFVGHLQMWDVPRARRQRPWLDQTDALIEAVLGRFVSDFP